MNSFVLIDGNSLVNRAFYALPPLNNKDGIPIQAVYGFTTMLVKAISDYSPEFLAVAFDLPKPTFRHLKYAGYKATRKGMPEELAVQLPILKQMLSTMGIKILEKQGFEADDIIGTMAKAGSAADCRTYVVTGDRDAFQLIDKNIRVVLTRRGLSEVVEYDEKQLFADCKLTPSQVIDYKALAGDSSDNIPGVLGIGEKTAISLVGSYQSLDGVYQNLDNITGKLKERLENGKESAYLSYELAAIDTAVPLKCGLSDCVYPFPFSDTVRRFFIDNSFKSLVKREELFSGAVPAENLSTAVPTVEKIAVNTAEELDRALSEMKNGAAVVLGAAVYLAADEKTEYTVNIIQTLIDPGLEYTAVLNALKPLLENPGVVKTVHDIKAFKKLLAPYKIELNNCFDVKLAQYIADMSIPYDTPAALVDAHGFDSSAPAAGLLSVQRVLQEKLSESNMTALYREIELPLTDILFRMECEGFKVDTERLAELGTDFSVRAEKLSGEIQTVAGQNFNVNSPKQLAKVLFEDLKIPYPKKGGNYSTAAEILEQLEGEYPIVQNILAYRGLAKLNSTYVEGLLKVADPRGIVHTDFKQTLTTTGRLSSVEPNLQNIPIREEEGRILRTVFIPKHQENVLICADYSQIELRLMAHLSGDKAMIAAYSAGEDIHASTAAGVFGVPMSEVTDKMRREAKAVNFGIIYGISDFGLAKNLGIPVYLAKTYIEKYFNRFPGVKAYMDASVELAKKRGYAETLFGRIRKIPELYSPNFNVRSFGERVAMNMPLQGTAADIIKIAMNRVDKALQGKKSKLILQVHDELIVDAPESEAQAAAAILKESMEGAAVLEVPLIADVGIGKNWSDCK